MKALEDRGIGRPSTYASILGTILDRGYVVKKGTALVPTFLAFAVTKLLEEHYGEARRLRVHGEHGGRPRPDRRRRGAAGRLADAVLQGRERRARAARDGHRAPRRDRRARGQLDRDPERATSSCASAATARTSSAATSARRCREDIVPDELTPEQAEELLAAPGEGRGSASDPETGRPVLVRSGRYGPYVTEEPPEGPTRSRAPPRSSSR